ncbi:kallikrein-11-like [Convolutriloba macropyga]|uniref:kallikrein-11-like n=1 Tax=Convolutriloba macropyga TaxID=536237 RepID=UPI003F522B2E
MYVTTPDSVVTEGKKSLSFYAGGIGNSDTPLLKKDACEGDSGSALECRRKNGSVYLCGIVSFGPEPPDCGQQPGAYVMVSHPVILDFIQSQMANEKNWTGGLSTRRTGDSSWGNDKTSQSETIHIWITSFQLLIALERSS